MQRISVMYYVFILSATSKIYTYWHTLSLHGALPISPRDAYSPFVARALRDAARTDVEAMFRRLGADDRTDEGDPVIASARADVEAIIARQGFIVADQPALKSLYFMRMRRALPIRDRKSTRLNSSH